VSRRAALRASFGLAGLGAVAALQGAGCSSTPQASSCTLSQVASYPASPLMLLADARLDRVPDGFLLLGVDKDVLRWVHIDSQRVAGTEQSAPVPASRQGGPWFAAAGKTAPADTILIAYGTPAANGTDLDITVVPAPADGSAPGAAIVAATIVGGAKASPAPAVTMASSQSGMHAGLGFTASGSGKPMVLALGGDGHPVSDPTMVDPVARISCLAFVPGKDDLSLAFLRYESDADTMPSWMIAEVRTGGSIESTLTLPLISDSPSCPLAVSTAAGYALAWQNDAGSTLGVYDGASNQFRDHLFASAVQFHGPELQPPLQGLGPAVQDFAVVFAKVGAGELWRISAAGVKQPGTVVFPSEEGNMGSIASVPADGSLYSSYADFEHTAAGAPATGQRYLIETTCF